MAALGKGIDFLLKNTSEAHNDTLLTNLSDAGRLFTSLYFELTSARRTFVYPYMNKETKDLLEKCQPTNLLFGPDVGEQVKIAKSLQSTTKDMQSKPPSSSFKGSRQSFVTKKAGGGE